MTPNRLAANPWPEVARLRTEEAVLVLIPVGSCEQHGPHLPFTVDSSIATYVALAAAADRADLVVAPTQGYAASGEHQGFPGTLSIGHDALELVLVELGRSATTWASRVLFVNGHGGNVDPMRRASTRLRAEGRDIAWWAVDVPGGDPHAGRTETSLMLAIDPARVGMDRAEPGPVAPLPDLLPAMQAGGVIAVSANGVIGDPTGATAGEGRALLAALGEQLGAATEAWLIDGTSGRLKPAAAARVALHANDGVRP